MAIPNSPNWSSDKEGGLYPIPSFPLPKVGDGLLIYDINIGPMGLSNSQGVLNKRYWLIYQDSEGKVVVRGSKGNTWDSPTTLFTTTDKIDEISISFDQLGRPIVLYTINETQLFLYWYNPGIGEAEHKVLGIGHNPFARFDVIYKAGTSYSDCLLFYVRDDKIWMRVQRDRFDIEYATPAVGRDIKILSSNLNTANRFQVSYRYEVDKP